MHEDDDAPPPAPDARLSPLSVLVWAAGGLGTTLVVVLVTSAVLPVLRDAESLPGWVVPLIEVARALFGVTVILVEPVLRYRAWRYAVREEEIDLLSGAIVRTRTLIPMARVQHVDTAQGLVGRALGLATLRVHTAADDHAIPGLPVAVASELRTEIARRARVGDAV